jgi:ribosomal protein S27E
MNVRILKKLIRTLQEKITCPGCGAKFNKPEQVQFRGYVDKTYFLQLNCLECPTLVFATVMVTPERELMADSREIDGLQPQERVEKLSKPKDKKEKKLKEISTNDVIDAHNFFEKFNGDFESMFGE